MKEREGRLVFSDHIEHREGQYVAKAEELLTWLTEKRPSAAATDSVKTTLEGQKRITRLKYLLTEAESRAQGKPGLYIPAAPGEEPNGWVWQSDLALEKEVIEVTAEEQERLEENGIEGDKLDTDDLQLLKELFVAATGKSKQLDKEKCKEAAITFFTGGETDGDNAELKAQINEMFSKANGSSLDFVAFVGVVDSMSEEKSFEEAPEEGAENDGGDAGTAEKKAAAAERRGSIVAEDPEPLEGEEGYIPYSEADLSRIHTGAKLYLNCKPIAISDVKEGDVPYYKSGPIESGDVVEIRRWQNIAYEEEQQKKVKKSKDRTDQVKKPQYELGICVGAPPVSHEHAVGKSPKGVYAVRIISTGDLDEFVGEHRIRKLALAAMETSGDRGLLVEAFATEKGKDAVPFKAVGGRDRSRILGQEMAEPCGYVRRPKGEGEGGKKKEAFPRFNDNRSLVTTRGDSSRFQFAKNKKFRKYERKRSQTYLPVLVLGEMVGYASYIGRFETWESACKSKVKDLNGKIATALGGFRESVEKIIKSIQVQIDNPNPDVSDVDVASLDMKHAFNRDFVFGQTEVEVFGTLNTQKKDYGLAIAKGAYPRFISDPGFSNGGLGGPTRLTPITHINGMRVDYEYIKAEADLLKQLKEPVINTTCPGAYETVGKFEVPNTQLFTVHCHTTQTITMTLPKLATIGKKKAKPKDESGIITYFDKEWNQVRVAGIIPGSVGSTKNIGINDIISYAGPSEPEPMNDANWWKGASLSAGEGKAITSKVENAVDKLSIRVHSNRFELEITPKEMLVKVSKRELKRRASMKVVERCSGCGSTGVAKPGAKNGPPTFISEDCLCDDGFTPVLESSDEEVDDDGDGGDAVDTKKGMEMKLTPGFDVEGTKQRCVAVKSIIPDSPAFYAGLNVGDVITHIDGYDLRGASAPEVTGLLDGARTKALSISRCFGEHPAGTVVSVRPLPGQKKGSVRMLRLDMRNAFETFETVSPEDGRKLMLETLQEFLDNANIDVDMEKPNAISRRDQITEDIKRLKALTVEHLLREKTFPGIRRAVFEQLPRRHFNPNVKVVHVSNDFHCGVPYKYHKRTVNAVEGGEEYNKAFRESFAVNRDTEMITLLGVIKKAAKRKMFTNKLDDDAVNSAVTTIKDMAENTPDLLNEQDKDGLSAVKLAADLDVVKLIKSLSDATTMDGTNKVKAVDLNAPDKTGTTAILSAAKKNNYNAVLALLESGANPNVMNMKKEHPLTVLLEKKFTIDTKAKKKNELMTAHLLLHSGLCNIDLAMEDDPDDPGMMIHRVLKAHKPSSGTRSSKRKAARRAAMVSSMP